MKSALKDKLENISILIVEDEDNAREMVVKHVSRLSNTVYSAPNGEEGLKVFKEKKPDIVISDIMMPIMDGLEMCTKIREINNTAQLLIFTAYGDRDQMAKSIDAGVNHFLFKPFELKIFKATLEQSVDHLIHLKELKKAKDESEQLLISQSKQAAMGEMLSMIAHQWKQPLAVASMNVNNLLADIELDDINEENFTESLECIGGNLQYLAKTIDDFRDFFKPKKIKTKITIKQVIENVIALIGKSLQNNSIEIKTDFNSETVVEVFDSELVQVYLNLINNSKDAILNTQKDNGCICIELYEENDWIITKITDNGGGIPKDINDKIFQPYFSTKGKNGTGLGLYMCSTIVHKHLNGTLEFENKNNGACFYIKLPKN